MLSQLLNTHMSMCSMPPNLLALASTRNEVNTIAHGHDVSVHSNLGNLFPIHIGCSFMHNHGLLLGHVKSPFHVCECTSLIVVHVHSTSSTPSSMCLLQACVEMLHASFPCVLVRPSVSLRMCTVRVTMMLDIAECCCMR